MNTVLVPLLYGMAGILAYAALQHLMTASQRPLRHARLHAWFALACAALGGYVLAKTGLYEADSAEALVFFRRWQITMALALFAVLPWFVREYTGLRPLWAPAVLTLLLAAVAAANHLLAYGITYSNSPALVHDVLPWGERVLSLRPQNPTVWHSAGWLGVLLVFAYGLYAGWQQYRAGVHHRAGTIIAALAVFMGFVLYNHLVNIGVIRFVHLAEFGFVAPLLLMGMGLAREWREAERRVQAILDNIPAVVYMKDTNGCYLFVNRTFEELFQVGNETVARMSDLDIFPEAQAQALRANDQRVLKACRAHSFEETVEIAGESRHFMTVKFPVVGPDGRVEALCGISTDITDSRLAEREIEVLRQRVWHADRVARVAAVASSLSHELTQPLTAIHTNAESGLRLLAGADGGADRAELQAILEDILRDDQRAMAVIDGQRRMLRRRETRRRPVGLAQTVEDVLDLVRGELVEQGVEYECRMDRDCVVLADKVQLGQVLLNLVMNALEAMRQQPTGSRRLEIGVSCDADGMARLAIRDSGPGWPPGTIQGAFDAFHTTKPSGLGMGLALCRSIVESHGGRIWADVTAAPGARVLFTLPLIKEENA